MPTLIRLLAMRIVASKRLGLFLKESNILSLLFLLLRKMAKSGGLSEKNAVSDPETSPEEIISKTSTSKPGKTLIGISNIIKLGIMLRS